MTTKADEVRANLVGLSVELAAALGSGWSVRAGDWAHQPRIDGPMGQSLQLSVAWNSRGQIGIMGRYPDGAHDMYDLKQYEINVSAGRPVAAFVKEIQRRLLPQYLVELARVTVWLDERNERLKKQKGQADQLAKMLPMLKRSNDGLSFYYYDPGGLSLDLSVRSSGSINVERMIGDFDQILPALIVMLRKE